MRKSDCLVFPALLLPALAAGSAVEQSKRPILSSAWKLNVEKSTFSPGPAPRSTVVAIESSTRVRGNTIDDTIKLNGEPIQKIHAVFSPNGKI
jgi:hypothetical protein